MKPYLLAALFVAAYCLSLHAYVRYQYINPPGDGKTVTELSNLEGW